MSSITIPWLNIVRRADPDRDRDMAREDTYEFSRGKTFKGDNRRTGVYSARVPAWVGTPIIEGPAKVGAVVRVVAHASLYIGAPAPSVAYEWRVDGVALPGEDQDEFTITGTEAGASLTCRLTLTNASGTATIDTAAIVPAA
jgi:hypothetical protein